MIINSVSTFQHTGNGLELLAASCNSQDDENINIEIEKSFCTHFSIEKDGINSNSSTSLQQPTCQNDEFQSEDMEETAFLINHAFLKLNPFNKDNAEITLSLKYNNVMEEFPLKIIANSLGFDFRIPLKNGDVNKAFYFYTVHRPDKSYGHLADLYPGYGIKRDYKLRGADLMRLIDVIAKVFKLAEVALNDKSSCWSIDGIREYEGIELENELVRFANLHRLSLEKDHENHFKNKTIEEYRFFLELRPGGFGLKYSRAMIKGNSWYGEHGYFPLSMTSEEYFDFIGKLRSTNLRQCFPEESSEKSSLVELMYREFAIHQGNASEHLLGDFFIWLSQERPHVISPVITDIRRARAGPELQKAFYEIEDFSGRMIKKYEVLS